MLYHDNAFVGIVAFGIIAVGNDVVTIVIVGCSVKVASEELTRFGFLVVTHEH